MDQKYLLVINGKPEGPFSLVELKEKGVKPNDFVRTDGMDDYKEAHEIAELRALFGFKKQLTAPQYFGSFDQRLLASAIDWFVVSAGFVVIALVLILFMDNRVVRIIIAISLLIVIPIAKIVYHVIMEASPRQGTYGKQLLKIRVCDMDGQRITVQHAIGRNLAKIVSVLTFFIGYLFAFFNKKQQCLHDMLAGTLIVKDRLV
jgi:uncharacterized RDD family membrane protein YckC